MVKAMLGVSLACLVALTSGPVRAADKEGPSVEDKLKTRISCDLINTPIVDALALIRAKAQVNLVIGPGLRRKNPRITLRLNNVACRAALRWMAEESHANCSVISKTVCFGTPAFVKRCKTTPLPASANEAVLQALERRLTFRFVEASLTDVVVFLKKQLKVHVLIIGGRPAQERLTCQLKDSPAPVALKYLGILVGRRVTADHGVIAFRAPGKHK